MSAKLKVILPFLLAVYIGIETILKANNIEVCSTTGCALAGELLKFNSFYLNYLGIAGALFLVGLAFFKSNIATKLYTAVAAAMVIFESVLIASQLNINPEPCIFCLGVYAFLILILINANFKVFLYALPAIGAVFLAFYILAIPKNKALIKEDGLYLIASSSCPHCKKTKEFLDKHNIKYKIINSKDTNAWYFAKSLNITKIPIAIEAKDGLFSIIVGDKKIIEKFSKKEQKATTYQEPIKPKINLSGEEGCGYSIIEESNCDSSDGISK